MTTSETCVYATGPELNTTTVTAHPTHYAFSGRTISRALRKRRNGSSGSSEHRGLRRKTQPQYRGANRFAGGTKFREMGEWVMKDGKEVYIPGAPIAGG